VLSNVIINWGGGQKPTFVAGFLNKLNVLMLYLKVVVFIVLDDRHKKVQKKVNKGIPEKKPSHIYFGNGGKSQTA
jgi:hypothetical protein